MFLLQPPSSEHTWAAVVIAADSFLKVSGLLASVQLGGPSRFRGGLRHAPLHVCLPISRAKMKCHILNSAHTETKENSMYQGYYIIMILP